jgi:hypothetical protein
MFCGLLAPGKKGNRFAMITNSTKKAEHTKVIILRQFGCLGLIRPVTFRPLLSEGLALSGIYI